MAEKFNRRVKDEPLDEDENQGEQINESHPPIKQEYYNYSQAAQDEHADQYEEDK
uniref:Uncharacterized protein n=1 Tax=Plectus sambesii TaxID=2011161 RepID=A0A914VFG2_9BILA